MISLDSRIEDHTIKLRESMIKFRGSSAYDIEICGAAFKPLTMYLNRQLIKILEDLGVPDEAFLALQNDAVEQLRIATSSPVNAASFFRRNNVGQSARLPWLVRELCDVGVTFSDDAFLRNILEVCILAELRELKHRSRIRVDQGMTVYGTTRWNCATLPSLMTCRHNGRDRNYKGGRDILLCTQLQRTFDTHRERRYHTLSSLASR